MSINSWKFGEFLLILLVFINVTISSATLQLQSSYAAVLSGRCREYQTIVRPDIFKDHQINCTQLTMKLETALNVALIQATNSCKVEQNAYEDFIIFGDHIVPHGQRFMLWSGVDNRMLQYTTENGIRFYTIRSTLIGHMVQDLDFCHLLEKSPLPDTGNCSCWTTEFGLAFWRKMSHVFAKKIEGHVYIALNGSRGDKNEAFSFSSIFYQVELPTIWERSRNITGFTVLLAQDLTDRPNRENCSSRSLITLKKILIERWSNIDCQSDAKVFRHELCQDEQFIDSPKCKFLLNNGKTFNLSPSSLLPMQILLFIVTATFLSIFN